MIIRAASVIFLLSSVLRPVKIRFVAMVRIEDGHNINKREEKNSSDFD